DSLVAKVEPIHDVLAIPGMQRALDDSFLRSIKQKCPYRFEPFLKLFNKNTNIISIYGLFFKDDSINPKAFVAGINHGPIFEYSIAGSASDAELRKFKFNNILLWKLIEEAKNNNCNFLDLGGISIESPENPTSGISKFKRHYPGFELTVGHEVLKILNPFKYQIFQTIKYLISLVRRT
ncbi:MAG: peptidoglycan bridge formation glycyltransferase FemA/FemB family protein, partial [Bacteriovorax sp.]|nr:peptidoglycan bridge formation glycyltransferase FemA/FemB family protein [Bacteriovorax sp.]